VAASLAPDNASILGALRPPDLADRVQLAFDRTRHSIQAGRDLGVGESFQLEQGHHAQLGIAQGVEQASAFLAEDRGQLRRRLGGAYLVKTGVCRNAEGVLEIRIAADAAGAAFGGVFAAKLIDRLVDRGPRDR